MIFSLCMLLRRLFNPVVSRAHAKRSWRNQRLKKSRLRQFGFTRRGRPFNLIGKAEQSSVIRDSSKDPYGPAVTPSCMLTALP